MFARCVLIVRTHNTLTPATATANALSQTSARPTQMSLKPTGTPQWPQHANHTTTAPTTPLAAVAAAAAAVAAVAAAWHHAQLLVTRLVGSPALHRARFVCVSSVCVCVFPLMTHCHHSLQMDASRIRSQRHQLEAEIAHERAMEAAKAVRIQHSTSVVVDWYLIDCLVHPHTACSSTGLLLPGTRATGVLGAPASSRSTAGARTRGTQGSRAPPALTHSFTATCSTARAASPACPPARA